jgi:hypothetical protein
VRQFNLLPLFLLAVVALIHAKGGDAVNVCMNTVAMTFILQLNNFVYIGFLSDEMKMNFEMCESIRNLAARQRQDLTFVRNLCAYTSVFYIVSGSLFFAYIDSFMERSELLAYVIWIVPFYFLEIGLEFFLPAVFFIREEMREVRENGRTLGALLQIAFVVSVKGPLFTQLVSALCDFFVSCVHYKFEYFEIWCLGVVLEVYQSGRPNISAFNFVAYSLWWNY